MELLSFWGGIHVSQTMHCNLSSLNYTPVQYLNVGSVAKKHYTNVAVLIDSSTLYYYCAEKFITRVKVKKNMLCNVVKVRK